jgi:hypothetical protein
VAGLEKLLETDFPPPNGFVISSWDFQINSLREATVYALAKLGVQKYLDEIYARDNFNFRYLGTKEAFLIHLERNFVWNRMCVIPSGGGGTEICAIAILVDAMSSRGNSYLINIPEEIRRLPLGIMFGFIPPSNLADYDPSQDEQNRERIEKIYYIYNWIMENQDVWEIREQIDSF